MASFLRSVLQILLGAILGWSAAVYYLPSSRPVAGAKTPGGPVVRQPVAATPTTPATGGAAPAADTNLFGRPGGTAAPGAFAEPRVETPKPAEPATVAVTQPAEPAVNPEAPAPVAPPAPEEPVDFRELCIKPAAWPPIITLAKEINAQVMQGEEVIAEIPLSAGEKLQVSKVYGDATVEVRAKGAKFVVKAADTDIAALARARLAEISGRPRAPAPAPAPIAATPVVEPTPAPKEPTPAPRRGDDLDSKMRSLFGTPEKR